jgi:hypothetical protein
LDSEGWCIDELKAFIIKDMYHENWLSQSHFLAHISLNHDYINVLHGQLQRTKNTPATGPRIG